MKVSPPTPDPRWLVLVHHLPPKPSYLRVKVGRQLAQIGAVALKSTVYVLPTSDDAREDLQWVLREVHEAGGDATILEARLVDGMTDEALEARFRDARDADYTEIATALRALDARVREEGAIASRSSIGEHARVQRWLDEVTAIDFFGAPGREVAQGLMDALRARVQPVVTHAEAVVAAAPRGGTWVTRAGVHVDRIGSAWLVRRFIDPEARFKFVPPRGYTPLSGELRFDMFEAEFTHEGDRCTFEVLCDRFALAEPGLRAVSEIVHDIDVKDGRYNRPETAGFAALITGLSRLHRDDDARLLHGAAVFDALLGCFSQRG